MTTGNDFDPEPEQPELFSALLTPHHSLSHTGFVVLMVFLSVVSFGAGLAFLLMGAWPVFGFFGLDVLAVYWAFRINFRHAKATEVWMRLRLEPSRFILELQDNGRGPGDVASKQSRNGLRNMRKRMEDVGGSFEILAPPEGGALVRLIVPIHNH